MAWIRPREGADLSEQAARRGLPREDRQLQDPALLEVRRLVPDDVHGQGAEVPHARDRDRGARAVSVDTVLVSSPLDYAQAALLLGEQRAWTESLLGHDLAEVQPSARREYANLAAFYDPPHGQLLLARWRASRSGSWPSAGSRTGAARASASTCAGRRAAAASPAGCVQDLLSVARALGFRSLYIETSPHKMGAAVRVVPPPRLPRDDEAQLRRRPITSWRWSCRSDVQIGPVSDRARVAVAEVGVHVADPPRGAQVATPGCLLVADRTELPDAERRVVACGERPRHEGRLVLACLGPDRLPQLVLVAPGARSAGSRSRRRSGAG